MAAQWGRHLAFCCPFLAVLILIPLLLIFFSWLEPEWNLWRHVADTQLRELFLNTAILVVGVGAGTLVLGVGLAWLTAMCEFPGRRLFDWALMLPLAVPTYVLAFVFVGLFDYAGPVQSWMRSVLGPDAGLPPIRSAGGVVFVMTLVLYPYVYMLTRAAFLRQGRVPMEAARMQGLTAWQAFFRVTLPMARPAIVAGVSLALMEALADFGAVAVFNFNTFTVAIYRAWFSYFSMPLAAQLASLLLILVVVALVLERLARGKAKFFQNTGRGLSDRIRLHGGRAWAATAVAGLVLALGFILPLLQLVFWAISSGDVVDARFWSLLLRTVTLGAIAAVVVVALALLLAYAKRLRPDWFTRKAVFAATLGYALPGSVLAVGIMLTFAWVDRGIAAVLMPIAPDIYGPWLSGSVVALIFAYVTRFMAVGFGAVDSALEQVRPSLAEAAHSLGASHFEVVRRVYIPMLSPGLLTGALLVCVDVMKEMPATLLLRPFGWDTLAVRIFEFTSEGEWERAALPAVVLVLAGLLPVILLVTRSAAPTSKRTLPTDAGAPS
ncbi:iron ABC transporter permease [Alkalilimnicola ehrlichii]|uniref:ABC transporter permease n=1 Tax=Alkalilimnicola ehrlichii TaxID=351052 RepID=UPI000E2E90BA|nr:iron ABC transporter permease [Alkalilimnicola ehrlichii]